MMTTQEQAAVRAIARQHLVNADQAADAFIAGRQLPPLLLKSGFTVHHGAGDPAAVMLGEIFHGTVYTGSGFYEPMPGDVVIDGGANIGMFMLYILSLERNLRVFCFEPFSSTRERLQQNIAANGLSDRVTVHPYALFSSSTVMRLKSTPSSGETSFFERWNTLENQPGEEVQCISLPAALDLCGVDQVDLLKLDVEGAELEILEGASQLDWVRIRRIALEFHNFIRSDTGRRVAEMLKAYGYEHIDFTDDPAIGMIRASRARRA
jgi:FkbM family methyltransferase